MLIDRKTLAFLFLFPTVLFCLSFTLENVESYRLGKPAVCVDTNYRVYLVGNTSGNDTVKYIQRISGPWQVYSINFTVVAATNYNSRTGAALGPDQSLHIIYRVTGGTHGWPVCTNNIGGSFTAADTLTKNGSESSYNYGIAVDSLNRDHAVCEIYTGSSSVKYYYPYADSQLLIASNAGKPTIAVDRNNIVHIAYASPLAGPKIYYTNNSGGSFSTPVLVSDSAGTDPSIAVDTTGYAHICWASGFWDMNARLYYATNKTGSFQTKMIPTISGYGKDYTQIALSTGNDVAIIAWLYRSSPVASHIICASKKADDIDFVVDSVGPAHTNASWGAIIWNDRALAFDRSGYIHFAYGSPSGTIYAKSQTPVGAEELTRQGPDPEVFKFDPQHNPGRTPLRISYHHDRSANVTMKLYDAAGMQVRNFGEVRGSHLVWDGRDQAGKRVPGGVYLLRAELRYGDETNARAMKLVVIN